ncbi:MAG: hypothetical protein V4684_07475 [Pseudomonadota bacterium]
MKITLLSAGRERSVALAADGTAYAWGGVKLLGATLPPGYPGELCTNSPTEIGHNRFAQPTPLALNRGQPFSVVGDGYVDTLAVTRAGTVLSCRPIVSSEKGATNSRVGGLPTGASQVACAETAGFALYPDGSVWSWGMVAQGQLGRKVDERTAACGRVEGLPAIASIAAGHGHVLALDRQGKVWSWGANAAGQLGQGDLRQTALPTRIALAAPIVGVAAGDTHSFAVDAEGRLWGWGSNQFGQVGELLDARHEAKYYTQPRRVKTAFAVAQVDAGMFFTVARSTGGQVFAWGWNGMGQLAQDGVRASHRPLPLKSLERVTRIAAGVGHTLALCEQGVFAWGDNRASACGAFPSTTVQVAPLRIALA